MEIGDATRKRIETLLPRLNEADRRMYLAAEAESLGRGGIGAVAEVAGVSRNTVAAGARDLALGAPPDARGARVRRAGGGRKAVEEAQPGITEALLGLVDDSSYGDPENPLRWTTRSLRNLADALRGQGFSVSHEKVGQLLEEQGFSLQRNRKRMQVGREHPDRDAQFKHINRRVRRLQAEGCPVVSLDCKKKELVGRFANPGSEWRPRGAPVEVLDHDFALPGKGKAAPYGVYDVSENEAWVSVGISRDTARFAVNTLQTWWDEMGRERYEGCARLLLCCDGGGSNSSRSRLWKRELQFFCDRNGLEVEVCHYPPGTSKWNKIEHRLFSQISKNWRGRPLESVEAIVSLIAATTNDGGLKVRCDVDTRTYEAGVKVTDDEMESLDLERNGWHGDWNYVIRPRAQLPLGEARDADGDNL